MSSSDIGLQEEGAGDVANNGRKVSALGKAAAAGGKEVEIANSPKWSTLN